MIETIFHAGSTATACAAALKNPKRSHQVDDSKENSIENEPVFKPNEA
jgi:hypothetical protein